MPYQAYQLYQIERPKSRAEIRQANERLGQLVKIVSGLRKRTAQAVIAPILPRGSRAGRPWRGGVPRGRDEYA